MTSPWAGDRGSARGVLRFVRVSSAVGVRIVVVELELQVDVGLLPAGSDEQDPELVGTVHQRFDVRMRLGDRPTILGGVVKSQCQLPLSFEDRAPQLLVAGPTEAPEDEPLSRDFVKQSGHDTPGFWFVKLDRRLPRAVMMQPLPGSRVMRFLTQ